jgi:RNA binding exosome subunit
MKYLYHITDKENLEKIKTLGLSPEFSQTVDGVYLSNNECHAKAYEGHHGNWAIGALIRVKLSKLNTSFFSKMRRKPSPNRAGI